MPVDSEVVAPLGSDLDGPATEYEEMDISCRGLRPPGGYSYPDHADPRVLSVLLDKGIAL